MAKNKFCGAYKGKGNINHKDMQNNNNVFVVKHGDDWATRTAGRQRVTKTFTTQKQAVDAASNKQLNTSRS